MERPMDTLVKLGLEKEKKMAQKKIYVLYHARLGAVAFPQYFEVDLMTLVGATEDPTEVTLFETLEDFQAAERPWLVKIALEKLTLEDIAVLREAFAKGELDHIGQPAPEVAG